MIPHFTYLFSESKKLREKWEKDYQPFQSKVDFKTFKGCVNEILYYRKYIIVFTISERSEHFILLSDATVSFEDYKRIINGKPFCPISFCVWRNCKNDEDFYFVRSLKVNWSSPIGFKFVLKLKDGTEYVMDVPDDKALALKMADTMKSNIEKNAVYDDLSGMLKASGYYNDDIFL
jgi:hypothetical protein